MEKLELITRLEAIELLQTRPMMFEALVNLGLKKHPPINRNDQYSYDKKEVMELKGLDYGALLGYQGSEKFSEECEKWGENIKNNLNK